MHPPRPPRWCTRRAAAGDPPDAPRRGRDRPDGSAASACRRAARATPSSSLSPTTPHSSTRPACSVAAAAPARRTLAPRMYGPPASTGSPPTGERSAKLTDPERRPGSLKGFVNEMRMVAMKLHTKDQAKEGMQEKSTLPITEWKYVLRPAPLFFFFFSVG